MDPEIRPAGQPEPSKPPERFLLPSPKYRISWSAQAIFAALAKLLCMFIHSGVVVEIALTGKNRHYLRPVEPCQFQSRVEMIGELYKDGTDNKGQEISRPSRCSEAIAKSLLGTREAEELLPKIVAVSACPVLTIAADGTPKLLTRGYNSELGGVFVSGGGTRPQILQLDEAVSALLTPIRDFHFQTKDDKARAIAAMLTPAFVYGQLLPEARVPMFIMEANRSQTGKGYFVDLLSAMYGERPVCVVPRKGGVGSFDEDFNAALLRGCPIIMLDNLRGKLDSIHIESFMTASGTFMARTFRRAPADIDPRRYVVFATGNRFEATPDMENRAVGINLRKRRQDYVFDSYKEGDVLAYVRAHQRFYLSCIHSVIGHWIAAGRPTTDENRHSFRQWAQAMDWIIRNVFGERVKGRLMDYDVIPAAIDLAEEMNFEDPREGGDSTQDNSSYAGN
jgi:hypothetical protein